MPPMPPAALPPLADDAPFFEPVGSMSPILGDLENTLRGIFKKKKKKIENQKKKKKKKNVLARRPLLKYAAPCDWHRLVEIFLAVEELELEVLHLLHGAADCRARILELRAQIGNLSEVFGARLPRVDPELEVPGARKKKKEIIIIISGA
jgi:hypothetical protein